MRIASGSVDRVIYFVAVDATDGTTRETGLSSFTVYRSRNGAAPVLYTTPTVTELSAANMPGVYALLLDEDTTIAAGHDAEEYVVHVTQAAMTPVTRAVELYRPETTEGQTVTVAAGVAEANVVQLAAAVGNKIADHVLRRPYGSARTSSDGDAVSFRSLLGALGKLVNRWSIVGGTLTVYQEDDLTFTAPGGTQTLTGTPGADPITQVDT